MVKSLQFFKKNHTIFELLSYLHWGSNVFHQGNGKGKKEFEIIKIEKIYKINESL